MPVDLSLAGRLGIDALHQLSDAVDSARNLAMASGQAATKSLAFANQAKDIIKDIAKINPALVGNKILHYHNSQQLFPSSKLFQNPMRPYQEILPSSIELTSIKAPPLKVHRMVDPVVTQGVDSANSLLAGLEAQRRSAIQDFL